MFDIGFWELVVVLVVALLAIRPEKMPFVVHKVGTTIRQLKQTWTKVRSDIRVDLEQNLAHEHLKQAEHKDFKNLSCDIQQSLDALYAKAHDVQRPYPPAAQQSSGATESEISCPKQPPAS